MTPAEVVANLRVFNDWRRGELDDLSMPDPREIGEAIDAAVEMVERFEAAEKERDALRAEVETTENDAAHQKTLAESTLRVAEGGEMMDTQEQHMLLELAARAAGYKVDGNWNPLTNDGDAFRLAVFLFRDIHFWYFDGSVSIGNDLRIVCGDDPCAATRLAIVRAAAEIGRNMK